jgi:pimeloyl-ACP methyl ester carboxylesterase
VSSAGAAGRARLPDVEGVLTRDGVRIAWARYGDTGPDVVLLPTWSIVQSRFWKAQVPYLARHYRVTTFDGRGSGRSDRPRGAAAYSDDEYVADTVAVMDGAGVPGAVLVGLSCAASWAVRTAAAHPDRVHGIFAIAPSCGLGVANPEREAYAWDVHHDTTDGWAKYNKHYWSAGPAAYHDFVAYFAAKMFSEPHSTKQIEDFVGWAHEIDAQVLVDATAGRLGLDGAVFRPLEPACALVRCPVTVMHGTNDAVRPPAVGKRLAELTGGELLLVNGGGHGLPARDPVLMNREIRAFVDRVAPASVAAQPVGGSPPIPRRWTRALDRRKRALYLCSPIGLGHARRDVAIAGELKKLHPDLQIDWLAQDPVSRVLADHGERIHPASAFLANESAHIEDECGEHDLNAFAAIRAMDEILVNNFMVFDDLMRSEHYDLVIGDEAWEVDHFLHENPELKRSAYAWLTDFVGWLPMPAGGDAEAALTTDYNAEMLEQRARFRGLRDRSVFVGDPDDVVPDTFGPGLPRIWDWTVANFDFAGYVTGLPPIGSPIGQSIGSPIDAEGREALRRSLGYRADEQVCLVTVGGSGVGLPLLRRIADAAPTLHRHAPQLRVVLVTGPRIPAGAIEARPGLDVRGYLPDLDRQLAACDVAVVQGGLSTCMELTANRRPFVYVPLRNHFEQNRHVRHRLERYRAGHCLDYELAAQPDALAAAVLKALEAEVDYRPVATDGAARAARLLADLL